GLLYGRGEDAGRLSSAGELDQLLISVSAYCRQHCRGERSHHHGQEEQRGSECGCDLIGTTSDYVGPFRLVECPVLTDVTPEDHESAAAVAIAAGQVLLGLRASQLRPEELKAEGDRRSHQLVLGELGRRYPDDAVLSEEAADDLARLTAARVWIVDPLDGTREY